MPKTCAHRRFGPSRCRRGGGRDRRRHSELLHAVRYGLHGTGVYHAAGRHLTRIHHEDRLWGDRVRDGCRWDCPVSGDADRLAL